MRKRKNRKVQKAPIFWAIVIGALNLFVSQWVMPWLFVPFGVALCLIPFANVEPEWRQICAGWLRYIILPLDLMLLAYYCGRLYFGGTVDWMFSAVPNLFGTILGFCAVMLIFIWTILPPHHSHRDINPR